MFTRIIDYFIPAEAGRSEESLRRARLAVGVYLIISLSTGTYSLLSVLINFRGGMLSQIPLMVVSLISVFLYRQRVRESVVAFIFFTTAIVSISTVVFYSGGFDSFILPWLATTPIVALLVSGKRMGLYTLVLQTFMLVVFYVLDLYEIKLVEEHQYDFPGSFILACQIGLVLLLYVIAIVFENGKVHAMGMLTDKNTELQRVIRQLKETQDQLVQQEKLASLGQLTAGIAHEIQNPLNFVNNFSEVNAELLEEMREELKAGKVGEAMELIHTIIENEEKINQHGKRADSIVKGMLQHSRSISGPMELKDINALTNEYLRLSYHGLRAKDKTFNASYLTEFDPKLPMISVVPDELGRVILNLINNAFYAVNEKAKKGIPDYNPQVVVTTKRNGQFIEIRVSDNADGIPDEIVKKIFQPFFTTKPSGQGTGLGLSLSYDIVTKGHGGELNFKTRKGEGSDFIIVLPA
jgi:two-component system, NtrC family, sensor kinase